MTASRPRWAPPILKLLFAGLLLVVLAQALDLGAAASVLATVDPIAASTVFALFADRHAAVRAARTLRHANPGWWVAPTLLR